MDSSNSKDGGSKPNTTQQAAVTDAPQQKMVGFDEGKMAGLSEEKKQSLKRPRSDAEEHNDDAAEVKQAAPKDPPKILTPEEEAKALAAMDFSEEKKAAVLRGSHYRTLSDGELWSLAPGDLSDAEAALELKKARQLDN
eukprot:CAMPEP_0194591478 /NCGR_PEP_ID=MMETSP0292-20121207/22101_1 /TAXON_ID=39354 /ORGANISM="Heterosigma akashiwo, Strain CCMP2393" /LENGTH=138 /DNA_ID=CAMNT_0039449583 /DNA_START=230 /DNA_END=643 /DNA_ORIENTATION=-